MLPPPPRVPKPSSKAPEIIIEVVEGPTNSTELPKRPTKKKAQEPFWIAGDNSSRKAYYVVVENSQGQIARFLVSHGRMIGYYDEEKRYRRIY
jgi:hypothetical protein